MMIDMNVRRIRGILCCLILWLTGQGILSQPYTTRDNYTGRWENPQSWDPTWASPEDTVYGTDITINGFITLDASLRYTGTICTLFVNDTLIIKGDLYLNNNISLVINEGGILIIKGNLTINNNPALSNGGYLIVTGNFSNNSAAYGGSFTSSQNPSHVFIGGTVPLIDSNNYPVLDCSDTVNIHYTNSGCSYGNATDLMADPIYDFFLSKCELVINSISNSPVCAGDTIQLTAGGGTTYSWSGPSGYSSNEEGPSITKADVSMAGLYIVNGSASGCNGSDTVEVIINDIPEITANSNSPVCEGGPVNLTMTVVSPSADEYSIVWSGPQGFTSIEQSPVIKISENTMTGLYIVKVVSGQCSDTASTSVQVNPYPVANAGPDQLLENSFETNMQAEILASETGEWSLISGKGNILDIGSPSSTITGLKPGENKFLWTVRYGNCTAVDEMVINVNDLFIPSVITPNGDGANDFFQIKGTDQKELIVLNRWGIIEYSSSNYLNNWDGRNSSGNALQEDTYFYIVKFRNGNTRRGSILIKR